MYQISSSDLEKISYKNIQSLHQKKILLRTCLNVPTDEKWIMLDDSRFLESYPLIKELALEAKMLLITAHLGRPKNQESRFSFEKIAHNLQEKFDQDWIQKKVIFLKNISEVNQKNLNPDDDCVYFLQNIRFFKEEESEDLIERKEFAKRLSQWFDCFVNDAFADYRESASTFDVATVLPSFLWPVFFREVTALSRFSEPAKPFVAVLGWAKLSEKIDILYSLAEKADAVLIWWAMAYTLLKSQWVSVWNSLVEEDKLSVAKEILEKYWDKIILPIDHFVVSEFKDPGDGLVFCDAQEIPDDKIGVDIWNATVKIFGKVLESAHSVLVNWPLGVYEWQSTMVGTQKVLASVLATKNAYKIIWGGDSISVLQKSGFLGFDHISTGGWAMLSFLAYDRFPTLDAILQSLI